MLAHGTRCDLDDDTDSCRVGSSTRDTLPIHDVQPLVGELHTAVRSRANVALESLALGCRLWMTVTLNTVPRAAQQLTRAGGERGHHRLAHCIYCDQNLPVVGIRGCNQNQVGTIRAAKCDPRVNVGVLRRTGLELLEGLTAQIAQAEARTAAERGHGSSAPYRRTALEPTRTRGTDTGYRETVRRQRLGG